MRWTLCCLSAWSVAGTILAADPPPRPLLTTSRVIGSPEPPPPYRARLAFPRLKFNRPVYLAAEPGTDRLIVAEQGGRIVAFHNDPRAELLDTFCEVKGCETYSLAFHPAYARNGYVYVFGNGASGGKVRDRIFRFQVQRAGRRACDPASQQLVIEWDSNGHNGGDLAFGRDGFLYITSGDGTSDSDGNVTGQDLSDLASGILRLDVDRPDAGRGYSVPKDNPFIGLTGARPELWAFGLRNPWRMSMDPATGELWVGDVGQDLWEMIRLVRRGANYGWSVFEGNHPFRLERKRGPGPIVPPIAEHPHAEARSITGGFVYHGKRLPDLAGAYVYGDYVTGTIWGLRYAAGKVTWQQVLANTRLQIVAFGRDQAGELHVVDHGGQIYELEPAPANGPPRSFPRTLNTTGLFVSAAGHRVEPALIPYGVNSPLWSDGASKERLIALPGDARIAFTESGPWGFPEGTVLVKTFALDVAGGTTPVRRRIETRLLTLQQGQWHGYTYAWNDAQSDGELVPARGMDREYVVADATAPGGARKQTWHYPSRSECMVCHSRAAGFVLGLTTLQMNKEDERGGSQLRRLERLGVFEQKPPKRDVDYLRLANPYDAAADLNLRARSYLHANCAQCHVWAGGGNSAIDLHFSTPRQNMQLVGVPPVHDRYGIREALLVAPADPSRSVLIHRVGTTGPGRMPPLASSVVDQAAVRLLSDWIRQMK